MSDNADFTVEVQSGAAVDTVDIIGRLLNAEGHGPFSDGASGVGGSGDVGVDSWEGRPVGAPTFDARDEIYLNGLFETSNPADLSVGADLTVHHVYGVIEDFFN